MPVKLTAEEYMERLEALQSSEEFQKIQRYFKTGEGEYGEGDTFMGVKMGHVFALSKEYIAMPPNEIEKLLESPLHEARAGALSIMAKQAEHKKTSPERKKELFDLYVRRTDRINNWDLVDLGAQYVVGGYLFDKPRDLLYDYARSDNLWERRTAIFSTSYFIRRGDLDDTYKIAEILLQDQEELIHKATGWMLRWAGDHDRSRLLRFLDQHAATMPRTLLRAIIEKLTPEERKHYMSLKPG